MNSSSSNSLVYLNFYILVKKSIAVSTTKYMRKEDKEGVLSLILFCRSSSVNLNLKIVGGFGLLPPEKNPLTGLFVYI